jgi:hypothetical protein
MPATFFPAISGCRSFRLSGRWRLASEMISAPRSTSRWLCQSASTASSGKSATTALTRSIASTMSVRHRMSGVPALEHAHRGVLDPLSQRLVQTVVRHDIGLAAKNGRRPVQHLHQFEQAELAPRVVEEQIDIGVIARVATRGRAEPIKLIDAEPPRLGSVRLQRGDGGIALHGPIIACVTALQSTRRVVTPAPAPRAPWHRPACAAGRWRPSPAPPPA